MNAIEASQLAIDPQGLGDLKRLAGKDEAKALHKVAQQFEALLLDQVMKSMRKASFGDDLFQSDATRAFRSMLDEQYVQNLTRGRGLGLADIIVEQVRHAKDLGVKKPGGEAVKA
ncbi:MAG: hypothetical protein GC151_17655 [Betaproteobacteria bacterium]|nr:hypothetical protein [Betaproteobacteria bacterium]